MRRLGRKAVGRLVCALNALDRAQFAVDCAVAQKRGESEAIAREEEAQAQFANACRRAGLLAK